MGKNLITTDELRGLRALGGKKGTRRIGKVRSIVFHPKEKRVVGFIVKRPDLLWMFHRKDKFVSIEGYDLVDGRVVIREDASATDRAACKALGIAWDSCVLWEGLPILAEDGTALGAVGKVTFDRLTGEIDSIETDSGATANTLLGKREIPASLIRGFRRGIGAELRSSGQEGWEDDEQEVMRGAVLVADDARDIVAEGGVAEQAGKATAVALDKAQGVVDKAKPVASAAAKKTGEVVNKGAYVTGRQIARTKGMFSGFKEEYSKARGTKKSAAGSASAAAKGGSKQPEAKASAAKSASSVTASSAKKGASAKSASSANGAAKASAAKTSAAKKAAAKKAPAKKNMFAAFKDEYDKARRS